MVSSKKIHCAHCQKKCTGTALRYQDQYYHKQCFELEQQQRQVDENEERSYLQTSDARTTGHLQQRGGVNSPNFKIESAAGGGGGSNQANASQQKQLNNDQRSMNNFSSTSLQAATNSQPTATTNGQRQALMRADSNQRLTSSHLNRTPTPPSPSTGRSATLPHSISSPSNGFLNSQQQQQSRTLDNRQQTNGSMSQQQKQAMTTTCAGCRQKIIDGQALIALDLHWHVWCFKCHQCKLPLHGEYVAKDGRAYCERDYQKLFGITCVYCKRYITGKVLQAGEAHHFHPSCARCSKCGDPFVPGEEMYLQGEVTWHPRCGPGPGGFVLSPTSRTESSLMDPLEAGSQLRASRAQSPSLSSRSRSASPFSYMSNRQYGRASPAYADSEAVGDLSRVYTISYLNADPNQGYLRRPIEPRAPKSPQFSRPTSMSRLGGGGGGGGGDRSRCSSRSQQYVNSASSSSQLAPPGRERSVPRGMYSVLSGMGRSANSSRARSPSMMNEEPIQMAAYPSGQPPAPDSVPKIERDDFPAPPFPHAASTLSESRHHHSSKQYNNESSQDTTSGQERASRPRSREFATPTPKRPGREQDATNGFQRRQLADEDESEDGEEVEKFTKEEEELSKIANGIGKIFLQTLKEREKLRAWKRANLDPRNASRTPSATRELPSRMRYENPTSASPSRDMDRPRPWEEDELMSGGEHSPTRTRSSLGRPNQTSYCDLQPPIAPPAVSSSVYGYKVVQANRSTPKPGYGLSPSGSNFTSAVGATPSELSFAEQQRIAQARANDLLGRQANGVAALGSFQSEFGATKLPNFTSSGSTRSLASAAHFRRSMPNVAQLNQHHHQHHNQHQEGPPKLYPYHLLATSNYRLPPGVDRCHLERHLSTEEFQYIFHCDRLDFYRLPEWKRNELKRRARLF